MTYSLCADKRVMRQVFGLPKQWRHQLWDLTFAGLPVLVLTRIQTFWFSLDSITSVCCSSIFSYLDENCWLCSYFIQPNFAFESLYCRAVDSRKFNPRGGRKALQGEPWNIQMSFDHVVNKPGYLEHSHIWKNWGWRVTKLI